MSFLCGNSECCIERRVETQNLMTEIPVKIVFYSGLAGQIDEKY
jgi:hypothetical protein